MIFGGRPARTTWKGIGLLFIAYLVTAKGGLYFDPVGGFATLVWPPTGIAIAALLRWGWGLWPGVALGAFLANWTAGAPASAATGIAVGNTLEALTAVLILNRFLKFRTPLDRVRDALGLFLAVVVAVPVSASIGVFSLWKTAVITTAEAATVWRAWGVGDLLGALTVAPVLLTWGTPRRRRSDWRPATEEAAFILCLAGVNGLVFLPPFDADPRNFLAAYLLSVPLFWAALRFSPSGAAGAVLATAAFAVWGTAHGGGPFARSPLHESLFYLQVFSGTIAAATLLLSTSAAERRRTFRDLQASEDLLRRSNRGMEEVNRDLESSLREKETLLREVHHRVKNNLQTVHSLLSLQAGRVENPGIRADLQDCRERVMTMALVHEKLYRSPDLARIDFGEYLRDLTRHLLRSMGTDSRKVRMELETAPVALDVQEAIPCGLAVYELVSNALKHAFPGDRTGTIWVTLSRTGNGWVSLSVRDDGVGLPPGLDLRRATSLGLSLVTNLAGQIGGTLRMEQKNGTAFHITFPTAAGAGKVVDGKRDEVATPVSVGAKPAGETVAG